MKEGSRKDKNQRESPDIQLKGNVTTEALARRVRRHHAASFEDGKNVNLESSQGAQAASRR